MTDVLSPSERSRCMAAVRSKDTGPEVRIRRLVTSLGHRFRTNAAISLTRCMIRPDLVFPALRKALFVHGCFWHMHTSSRCNRFRFPDSRRAYWESKLMANRRRDDRNTRLLRRAGWSVLTIWECQLRHPERVASRISKWLADT